MGDPQPVHGSKGVYCGGEWLDIEDCVDWLSGPCAALDRRAHAEAMRLKRKGDQEENHFDVLVIGGGCVGGSIARELAKLDCSVLLLERDDDVTQGATKGNSGIVLEDRQLRQDSEGQRHHQGQEPSGRRIPEPPPQGETSPEKREHYDSQHQVASLDHRGQQELGIRVYAMGRGQGIRHPQRWGQRLFANDQR